MKRISYEAPYYAVFSSLPPRSRHSLQLPVLKHLESFLNNPNYTIHQFKLTLQGRTSCSIPWSIELSLLYKSFLFSSYGRYTRKLFHLKPFYKTNWIQIFLQGLQTEQRKRAHKGMCVGKGRIVRPVTVISVLEYSDEMSALSV